MYWKLFERLNQWASEFLGSEEGKREGTIDIKSPVSE